MTAGNLSRRDVLTAASASLPLRSDSTGTTIEWPFSSRSETKWSINRGQRAYIRGVEDGQLYVADEEGLSTVSPSSGSEKWRLETPTEFPMLYASTVGEETAAVVGGQTIYVLRRSDGELRREVPLDDRYRLFRPVVRGGRLYLSNGELRAVPIAGDGELWTFEPTNALVGEPLVRSSSVYVGDTAGTVHAVSVRDGGERWQLRLPGDSREKSTSPIYPLRYLPRDDESPGRAEAGTVFLWATDEGVLSAVSEATETVEWQFSFEQDYVRFPGTISARSVYAVDGDTLIALSPVDGSERWRFSAGKPFRWYFWASEESVYVHSAETLYAIAARSGRQRWRTTLEERTLVTVPEHGVSTTRRGDTADRITALSPQTGSVKWAVGTDSAIHSKFVSNGTVYIAERDGTVSARTGAPPYATVLRRTASDLGVSLIAGGVASGALLLGAYRYRYARDGDPTQRAADDFEHIETLDGTGYADVQRVRDSDGNTLLLRRYSDIPGIESAIDDWATLDIDGVDPVLAYDIDSPWVLTPDADRTLGEFSEVHSHEVTAKRLSSVIETVHRAHRRGVVHGHLVPESVLVDDDTVRVSDWGIHTATTGSVPTVDDDVRELGALAYGALCGEFPGEDPRPPSEVNEGLSGTYDEVLSRALAEDPAERYDSALKFADALRWAVRE